MSDAELLKTLDEAFDEAWGLLHDEDGWKEEKTEKDAVVCSKKSKKGKKMYRVKVVIDAAPEKLMKALESKENMCDWNTTLTKFEILKDLGNAKITYQVTTEGPGGVVSARDFILISKAEKRGNEWMQGGCSVEYPGPQSSKIVRAWNNPGGQFIRPHSDSNKSEFMWLMDCEFNGMVPETVLGIAMPHAQLQFIECVRKLAATL